MPRLWVYLSSECTRVYTVMRRRYYSIRVCNLVFVLRQGWRYMWPWTSCCFPKFRSLELFVMLLHFQIYKYFSFRLTNRFNYRFRREFLQDGWYNSGQGIWGGIQKSSKIGQDKKSLIYFFASFLTIVARVFYLYGGLAISPS